MSWRWWLERKARELKEKSDAAEKKANRDYYTDEHGTPRIIRRFEYKNFGEKQNLIAFTTLSMFIAAFVMGQKANSYAYDEFLKVKSEHPPVSDEYKAFVASKELVTDNNRDIAGHYFYRIEYQNGYTLHGDIYYGNDSTVSKSAIIGESMSMRGIADYEVVGAVIKYNDIEGDKFLFNDQGDVFEVLSDERISHLYEDGSALNMRTRYSTEPLNTRIVKDNRPLIKIIIDAHYTSQLQLAFLLAGIGLTIYLITKILMQWGENIKKKKNKGSLEA